MRLSRLKTMIAAGSVAATLFNPWTRADSTLYSSISGTTSSVYNYTAPVRDSVGAGIGDDYGTNYGALQITGLSFYGGLTRSNDYLNIYFYSSSGAYVGQIAPQASEVQGIGFHTLSAADFVVNGGGLYIYGSGYVVFAPTSYTSANVNTHVTTPDDPNPPVFSLGFGQAPTIGSDDPSKSAMTTSSGLTTGAFAATANQYAQFSITGTGYNPISSGSTGNSGAWSSPTSGTWEAAGNWQGAAFPSGQSQTATFADSIGAASATVTLTANETVGSVAFGGSAGGAYTIGSNGNNTLTLDNNGSPAVISVNAGSQIISAPVSLASGLNISTGSGTLGLGGTVTGTGPVTVNASSSLTVLPAGVISVSLVDAGTVNFAAQNSGSAILSRTVPGVSLQSGAVLTLAAASPGNARQVLVVTGNTSYGNHLDSTLALSLAGSAGAWTATLDLANNDAIIPNAAQFLATMNNQVTQGYGLGTWQGGGGIVSSSAAANSAHLTALGLIQNDNGSGVAVFGTFDGVAVSDADLLIKYTYYGDANLDGKVDGSDYSLIDNGYLNHLTGWFNGDFNYDGAVDGSDYALIDNAFNNQGAPLSSQSAVATAQTQVSSAVPEPASISFIGIGSVTLLGRRRRTA